MANYGEVEYGSGYYKYNNTEINIKEHISTGIDLLITQFRNKRIENSSPNPNNLISFLTSFLSQFNEIEHIFSNLASFRFIDTAYGIQLDLLGEIIGIQRNGRNDIEYSLAIKFQIYKNRSSGEAEVIIQFVKDITDATRVQLVEAYPAGIYIFTNGTNILTNYNISELIEELLAAGVKLRGLFYHDPDAVYFSFDWDGLSIPTTYGGLNELNYLESGKDVGGQFFELII